MTAYVQELKKGAIVIQDLEPGLYELDVTDSVKITVRRKFRPMPGYVTMVPRFQSESEPEVRERVKTCISRITRLTPQVPTVSFEFFNSRFGLASYVEPDGTLPPYLLILDTPDTRAARALVKLCSRRKDLPHKLEVEQKGKDPVSLPMPHLFFAFGTPAEWSSDANLLSTDGEFYESNT